MGGEGRQGRFARRSVEIPALRCVCARLLPSLLLGSLFVWRSARVRIPCLVDPFDREDSGRVGSGQRARTACYSLRTSHLTPFATTGCFQTWFLCGIPNFRWLGHMHDTLLIHHHSFTQPVHMPGASLGYQLRPLGPKAQWHWWKYL